MAATTLLSYFHLQTETLGFHTLQTITDELTHLPSVSYRPTETAAIFTSS